MTAVLVGTQGALLRSVAACLDQAGIGYGIVTSHLVARSTDLTHALDVASLPKMAIAQAGTEFFHDLSGFARSLRAEVIIPTDFPTLRQLSMNKAQVFSCALFPSAPPGLLDRLNNKWQFFEILSRAGLRTPNSALLHDPRAAVPEDIGYPAMIKPLAMGGGVGVHVVKDAQDLARRLAHWPPNQFPILVQEFIPGTDVDVSLLAENGRIVAWTVQRWEGEGTLVFEPDDAALGLARDMVSVTGFTGIAHIDMRRDERDGRVSVIECNPRFWNTADASLAAGVNFPVLGARIALGQDVAQIRPRTVRLEFQGSGAQGRVGPRGLIVDQ